MATIWKDLPLKNHAKWQAIFFLENNLWKSLIRPVCQSKCTPQYGYLRIACKKILLNFGFGIWIPVHPVPEFRFYHFMPERYWNIYVNSTYFHQGGTEKEKKSQHFLEVCWRHLNHPEKVGRPEHTTASYLCTPTCSGNDRNVTRNTY